MQPLGGLITPTVTLATLPAPPAFDGVTENVDVVLIVALTVAPVCSDTPGPDHVKVVAVPPPEQEAVKVTEPPAGTLAGDAFTVHPLGGGGAIVIVAELSNGEQFVVASQACPENVSVYPEMLNDVGH